MWGKEERETFSAPNKHNDSPWDGTSLWAISNQRGQEIQLSLFTELVKSGLGWPRDWNLNLIELSLPPPTVLFGFKLSFETLAGHGCRFVRVRHQIYVKKVSNYLFRHTGSILNEPSLLTTVCFNEKCHLPSRFSLLVTFDGYNYDRLLYISPCFPAFFATVIKTVIIPERRDVCWGRSVCEIINGEGTKRLQGLADVTQLVEQRRGLIFAPCGHYGGVAQATVAEMWLSVLNRQAHTSSVNGADKLTHTHPCVRFDTWIAP